MSMRGRAQHRDNPAFSVGLLPKSPHECAALRRPPSWHKDFSGAGWGIRPMAETFAIDNSSIRSIGEFKR
jgi:hypothetical protein